MSLKSSVFGKSLTSATRILQIFGAQFFTLNDSKENKQFSHYGSKISRKFKAILLFHLIVIAVFAAVALRIPSLIGSEIRVVYNLFGLAAMAFIIINTFFATQKTKLIFRKCEDISKIFEQRLLIDCDWIGFSRKCKRHLVKFYSIMLLYDVILFTFIFIYQTSRIYLLTAFLFINYLVAMANVIKLIFFVRLLNHNIELMIKVLKRLNDSRGEDYASMPFVTSVSLESVNNIYPTVATVKRIYGKLTEVVDLINSLNALAIILVLFFTVLGNSLSGYRIFLFVKHDLPFGEVGIAVHNMLRTSTMYFCMIYNCNKLNTNINELIGQTNKINLSQQDRCIGMQSICQEFLRQINQQPIQITAAGLYVIDKHLAASMTTAIVTFQIALIQLYDV